MSAGEKPRIHARASTADVLSTHHAPRTSATNGAPHPRVSASGDSTRHSGVAEAREGFNSIHPPDHLPSETSIPGSNPEDPFGRPRHPAIASSPGVAGEASGNNKSNSDTGEGGPLTPERKRGCSGKHRYPNKKAAITKLNRIMRSHRRNRPEHLRAYACEHCAGWHLTKDE